jgi:hypothetical protein
MPDNNEARRYYRTVIQIEVLSTDPTPRDAELETVAWQIREGDWSGDTTIVSVEEVDAQRMAELLIAQGSDPEFLLGDEEDDDETLLDERPSCRFCHKRVDEYHLIGAAAPDENNVCCFDCWDERLR